MGLRSHRLDIWEIMGGVLKSERCEPYQYSRVSAHFVAILVRSALSSLQLVSDGSIHHVVIGVSSSRSVVPEHYM